MDMPLPQVSVFGTGMSNHCMDFMGLSEQMGIDAAVTWLGTQDWSNGNVGIVGKSYDGTTPWQAAMFGNPHLKNYNSYIWIDRSPRFNVEKWIYGSKRLGHA
ncbi:MAG: CocE/NonD family hydrolase [Candidatus Poseidoniales archaeon]